MNNTVKLADETLEVLAKPIIDFLETNADPYCEVIVSQDSVKLVRTEVCRYTKKCD